MIESKIPKVWFCEFCSCYHLHSDRSQARIDQLYASGAFYDQYAPADWFEGEERDLEWLRLHFQDRLKLLTVNGRKGRILDVGCGSGLFLNEAARQGWEVVGIELAPQALARARLNVPGLLLEKPFLECRPEELGSFEALCLALFLEHTPDLPATLLRAWQLLNPAGRLWVQVPNDFSRLQRLACQVLALPRYWISPVHLNYFSGPGIDRLLRSIGFQVLRTRATFPMELYLLAGINYVQDPALGLQCHQDRMRRELAWTFQARRAYAQGLATAFLGRERIVLARRPPQERKRT